MKNKWYRIKWLLALITLTVGTFSTLPIYGVGYVIDNYYYITGGGDDVNTVWRAQYFVASSTYTVEQISVDIWAIYNNSPATLTLRTCDGEHKPTSNILSTGTSTDIQNTAHAMQMFNMNNQVVIQQGTEYAIVIYTPEDSLYIHCYRGGGQGKSDSTYFNSANGVSWSDTALDINFRVYGEFTEEAKITTLEPEFYVNNQVKLCGYVNSVGSDQSVEAYVEYGIDTNYGIEKHYGNISAIGTGGYYCVTVSNLPLDTTFHFRAYMIGNNTQNRTNGDDINFTLVNEGQPLIQTITAYDLTYSSFKSGVLLLDFASETELDLSLDYGLTSALGSNAVVASDVDKPGKYIAEFTGGDENNYYYYRAKAVGTNGTYYGKIKQTKTKNSSQPEVIQNASGWLTKIGFGGEGVWWLIILVLIAVTWIFLHDKRIKQVAACAITLLIVGAGIALSVIDVWLIILLAFGAGLTIFGFVLKNKASDN